jgi:hypothetical protein
MRTLFLNLWAWVLLHPEAVVSAALAVLSVVGATIANARAKGAPASWPEKFVDRLAVRTRANASNAGWSWPVIGKSIFEAALDASAPMTSVDDAPLAGTGPSTQLNSDGTPPRASGGFAEATVLRWIAAVALAALGALWLSGCPLPPPDGCTPTSTRCSPSGVPEVCSATQRWSRGPTARPCAELGSTCCRALSPYGGEVSACVPASVCLADSDAGAEGGAL